MLSHCPGLSRGAQGFWGCPGVLGVLRCARGCPGVLGVLGVVTGAALRVKGTVALDTPWSRLKS